MTCSTKYWYATLHTTDDGNEFPVPGDIIEWFDNKRKSDDKSYDWSKIYESISPEVGKPTPKALKTKQSAIAYFRRVVSIIAEKDQLTFSKLAIGFVYDELGMVIKIEENGALKPYVVEAQN